MLRVLHSVSNMDRAGIETMLMNYYRHIDRSKVQFDFLVNKAKPGAYDAEIRQLGGHIYQSPGLDPLHYPQYLRFVRQLLAQDERIRILHAHNEAMGLYALNGARQSGLRCRIAHAHNTRIQLDYKWPLKILCKSFLPTAATHLWACGQQAGRYFYGPEQWNARGMVLRNAIDTQRFLYDPARRAQMRTQFACTNAVVIGHVGRFAPQKNHRRLLEIFAALLHRQPQARLVLIGTGELEAAAHRHAQQLGVSAQVLFAGEQCNVQDWYQMMDLFLLPSRFEGLPVVGIEAQAAGLPCLFSDKVPAEVLLSAQAKQLPLDSSDEVWASVIQQMLQQPLDRTRGAQIVREAGYDITAEAARLQTLYLAMSQT